MFGYNPMDYDLIKEISKCCNKLGTVYLAKYKPTTEYVAVKKYKMECTKEESNLITNEVLTMRQFHHQHIQSFHSVFVNNFEMYMIAPLMCYCSCRHIMQNFFTTGIPEQIISLILRDVLFGLEYLHKKGFIHRAIRSSHILVNRQKVVLSGFGQCTSLLSHGERARTLHELPASCVKNLNWLAPEVLEQNLLGYTEKSDVYSLGITTCELANNLEPFEGMSTTLMLIEKIRGNTPALLDCSTCLPPLDGESTDSGAETRNIYGMRKLSDHFHKFAEICMSRCPNERPNVSQLLNHAFFKQTKQTTLAEQFLTCGINAIDCTKSKDENVSLAFDFSEMNIDGTFEWDF